METIEQRRSVREAVSVSALVRSSALKLGVVLINLSPDGCCVESLTMSDLQPGQLVTLRIEGLDTIGGAVTWAKGTQVGITFAYPLYGPLYDHLTRLHAMPFVMELAA